MEMNIDHEPQIQEVVKNDKYKYAEGTCPCDDWKRY